MNTHAKVTNGNRHRTRTLYVLAALYTAIGLGLAAVSAVSGEPLGAFLGFLIVSCTIGGTVLLRAVWRLNAQAAALSDKLIALSTATHRLERSIIEHERSILDNTEEAGRTIDLVAMGRGDPSVLAAAVLDRAGYPRLARAMNGHIEVGECEAEMAPPAEPMATVAAVIDSSSTDPSESTEAASLVSNQGESSPPSQSPSFVPPPSLRGDTGGLDAEGPTTNVLTRRWKTAYRESDLPACREVFLAFEAVADADMVKSMREQLDEVVARTERRLRMQFQQLVHEQQLDEALRVGGDIDRLLPDRPIAREFARIRPHLEKKRQSLTSIPVATAPEHRAQAQ